MTGSTFDFKVINNVFPDRVFEELEYRNIPTSPVWTYHTWGDPCYTAVYPRNGIDGSFAILNGTTLYLANIFAINPTNVVFSPFNDAEGVTDAILAGAIGGSLMGYVAAKVSQNHTIVPENTWVFSDKRKNNEIRVILDKNIKFTADSFNMYISHEDVIGFGKVLIKLVLLGATNLESATYLTKCTYGENGKPEMANKVLEAQGLNADDPIHPDSFYDVDSFNITYSPNQYTVLTRNSTPVVQPQAVPSGMNSVPTKSVKMDNAMFLKKFGVPAIIIFSVALIVGIAAKIKALAIVGAIGLVIFLLGLPSALKKKPNEQNNSETKSNKE